MNKLIVIGCMGIKRAYLNVPLTIAIQRYLSCEEKECLDNSDHISEFEFEDSFGVYDAWNEE